jgi:hypothetical protein
VVLVDGREKCQLDNVTTRPATNLARSVDVDVPGGTGTDGGLDLVVEVPNRSLRGSHRVTPNQALVVVNAAGRELRFVTPSGPYGYG